MMSKAGRLPRWGAATGLLAAAAAMPFGAAVAQAVTPVVVNLVPEATAETLHARIRGIDRATRRVTLAAASGRTVTVTAGPMVRLDTLNPGDTVNAKFLRSVAFAVSADANPPANVLQAALARPARGPGGAALQVTRVSALIVGIDPLARTMDVVDPSGGGVLTVLVTDPMRAARLDDLKVGDTVTAVVTETLAVTIEPATGLFPWR
jgi:hypothetical protein